MKKIKMNSTALLLLASIFFVSNALAQTMHGPEHSKNPNVKAYFEENIQPFMIEKRTELEKALGEEEKAIIAKVRDNMPERPNFRHNNKNGKNKNCERKGKHEGRKINDRKGCRENGEFRNESKKQKGDLKEFRKMRKEKVDELEPIIENHKELIEKLMTEIGEKQEEWHNEISEIMKTDGDTMLRRFERHEKRNDMRKNFNKDMHPIGFILMNINEAAEINFSEFNLYPNPVEAQTKLEFWADINAKFVVRIINSSGNIDKIVSSGTTETGENIILIDLSTYKTGVYYLKFEADNYIETIEIQKK